MPAPPPADTLMFDDVCCCHGAPLRVFDDAARRHFDMITITLSMLLAAYAADLMPSPLMLSPCWLFFCYMRAAATDACCLRFAAAFRCWPPPIYAAMLL